MMNDDVVVSYKSKDSCSCVVLALCDDSRHTTWEDQLIQIIADDRDNDSNSIDIQKKRWQSGKIL